MFQATIAQRTGVYAALELRLDVSALFGHAYAATEITGKDSELMGWTEACANESAEQWTSAAAQRATAANPFTDEEEAFFASDITTPDLAEPARASLSERLSLRLSELCYRLRCFLDPSTNV